MFLSVDPVSAYSNPVGQFHRYRYANNNPYAFVDPDGRQSRERDHRSICNNRKCDVVEVNPSVGGSSNGSSEGRSGALLGWTSNNNEAIQPHEYSGAERVCEYDSSNCTVGNFKENYGLWFSAPGQTYAAGNGTVNYLPAWGSGGPGAWPVTHEVEFYSVPRGMEAPFMRTANVTLPGHVLVGRVDRYYIARADGIYVNTIGRGILYGVPADGPPLNYFNNSQGIRLFKNLNQQLRQKIANDH